MFGIGMPELILILALALIVFGPKKLPDLARSLGKALHEFKNATQDFKDSMDSELKEAKKPFEDVARDVTRIENRPKQTPPETLETPDGVKKKEETGATGDAGRQAPSPGNGPEEADESDRGRKPQSHENEPRDG